MTQQEHATPFDLPNLPPALEYGDLVEYTSPAHASLARLDEILRHIPNPALIEHTFLTREAVLSSQIEGTQATLEEVFKKEAEEGDAIGETDTQGQDIREILNYRKALREGVRLVDTHQPLAENNVKALHAILLQSVRGRTRAPGAFRREQVYIAPPGTPIADARYIPPTPTQIPELYSNFDRYLNTENAERDPLVQIAVAHYQFEAIHPFADGNGRVGRLLIPLFLYQRNILARPYLYISQYLEAHRRDYYDLLADVSYKSAWTPWVRFFLTGLREHAENAASLARAIITLQHDYERDLTALHSPYASDMLKAIFMQPIFTTTQLRNTSGIENVQTTLNLIQKFVQAGVLTDITPERQRNKTYACTPLLNLLSTHTTDTN